jgi:hypothetical protein
VNVWVRRHERAGVEPTKFEAILLTKDNVEEVARWCQGFPVEEIDPVDSTIRYAGINLESMGGMIRASEGVIIQRGGPGMFFIHDAEDWNRRMKLIHGDRFERTSHTNDPFEGMKRA